MTLWLGDLVKGRGQEKASQHLVRAVATKTVAGCRSALP
jgi:hypothetical protein